MIFRRFKRGIRVPKEKHGIRRADIGTHAVDAISKLQKAGFDAYIVGGAIRDLLCDIKPKDFDIVTNATPPQIRALFKRQARIIGRRFKLVLLHYRRKGKIAETLEVSTFRARAASDICVDTGRIIADNTYGSVEEDMFRRDFTANALLYDPVQEVIIDYVGGYRDIKKHNIKPLRAPDVLFREDPLRMIRAIRLSTKLKAPLPKPIKKAMMKHRDCIDHIPLVRLTDEFYKIIAADTLVDTFNQLREFDLVGCIFRGVPAKTIDDDAVQHILAEADERKRLGKPISSTFIITGLFLNVIEAHIARYHDELPLAEAVDQLFTECGLNESFSRHVTGIVQTLYRLHYVFLHHPSSRVTSRALHHRYADRAMALIRHRAEAGYAPAQQAMDWWQKYDELPVAQRRTLFPKTTREKSATKTAEKPAAKKTGATKPRRARSRTKKRSSNTDSANRAAV